jgi:hypothetical protein
MIVGFNHNVNYKGIGFHVQTEDSGVKSPQLVTLLYHGGTIIASQKTLYADILKVDNLNQVVEDLAKEQHKGMLRRLTQGEFDQKIVALGIALEGVSPTAESEPDQVQSPEPETAHEMAPEVEPIAELVAEPDVDEPVVAAMLEVVEELPEPPMVPQPPPEREPVAIAAEPIIDKFRESKERLKREPTLDELIYAYLSGADQY